MKLTLPYLLFFLLLPSFLSAYQIPEASLKTSPVSVLVYPNPSPKGVFSLELRSTDYSGPVWVRVYDLIGNELYTNRIDMSMQAGPHQISIENYPNGIYLLEISHGERKQTLRLAYI